MRLFYIYQKYNSYLLVSRKHTEEMQKQVITIATSISRVFFFLNGMLRKCAPCQHIAICNWNICVCKKLLIRESWRCAMLICEFSFQNFYCGGLQIPCSLHEMILYTSNILDDTNMPIFFNTDYYLLSSYSYYYRLLTERDIM